MLKYVKLKGEYSGNAFSINIFSRSQAINLKFLLELQMKIQVLPSYVFEKRSPSRYV